MIILGESLLKLNSSEYLFEKIKRFLTENNKINDNWNSLNMLSCDASTVGSYDLGITNDNNLLKDLKEHKLSLIHI